MADATLVAISGATGLFGKAFLAKLPNEIKISGSLRLRNLSTLEIYREVEKLASIGTKSFLHLAWPASSSLGNYRTSEENFDVLQKTVILQSACLQNGVSFVGLGSVLDKVREVENYYHLTKFVCRKFFESQILDRTLTWVRPYYVFNHDSWPEFMHVNNSPIVRILNNSPRDFIHLDDIVTGLFAIIEHRIMGEVDLGSGLMTKPSDICEALGKKYRIESNPSGNLTTLNVLYAHPHLGLSEYWTPKITLSLVKEKQ
jgi:nucleoside-diphosphate-sugar epimerase